MPWVRLSYWAIGAFACWKRLGSSADVISAIRPNSVLAFFLSYYIISRRELGSPNSSHPPPSKQPLRQRGSSKAMSDKRPASGHNPYASASKWRHQESTAFADFAGEQRHGLPRDPINDSDTAPLADFLNSSRAEPGSRPEAAAKSEPIVVPEEENLSEQARSNTMTREIVCGPLLNYRGMRGDQWVGSALIVVKGGGASVPAAPILQLRRVGRVDGRTFIPMSGSDATPGIDGAVQIDGAPTADTVPELNEQPRSIHGSCLYSAPEYTFWQFDLVVEMEEAEVKWSYNIPEFTYTSSSKPQTNNFFVPASTESMRTMFYSCNGFSVGTDEEAWSGPALWNDVNRRHAEAPFHVMIGGGDQIYQDGIRVDGPLREWTDIQSPRQRAKYPFTESLRKACDSYYLENYIRWYVSEHSASSPTSAAIVCPLTRAIGITLRLSVSRTDKFLN